MSISTKTRVRVWGRAAHRCSFEGCRKHLEIDDGVVAEPSLVGEVAHMVAEKISGPRGDSALVEEERNSYENLLLLCKDHHKLVDDNPREYSVARLKKMKHGHEEWVRESLAGYDPEKQRHHEIYASYVEEWGCLAMVENWREWSSHVMGCGDPKMGKDSSEKLCELSNWIHSRVWPKRYPSLEEAFEDFRNVLVDFLETFHRHIDDRDGEVLWVSKFYQIEEWDPPRYQRLSRQWEFHVDLIFDLMFELTRAANRICDQVRETIDPMYRLREGLLMVVASDITGAIQYRAEYANESMKYPGLEQFKLDRKDRTPHYGEGVSVDDPNWNVRD